MPARSGLGKPPLHGKAQATPVRVDHRAAAQPPEAWQRLTWRGGEKGLLAAEYLHARLSIWDGSKTQARC